MTIFKVVDSGGKAVRPNSPLYGVTRHNPIIQDGPIALRREGPAPPPQYSQLETKWSDRQFVTSKYYVRRID